MQTITTIGLDIAKSVFQVHGVDADGKVVVRRLLKRRYVLAFFQKLPPCLVGIEACASSHHWSRELQALGHTVRLMPPAYVKPYVKRQKNDAADAEAICEAVTRPNMRFVPTKTPEQQSCLTLHRTRHLFIRQQTAVINSIRAYLAEFGIVAPVGRNGVERLLEVVADVNDTRLPEIARACVAALVQVFGRRQRRSNHTLWRPASEKRQGTKSRCVGHWLAAGAMAISNQRRRRLGPGRQHDTTCMRACSGGWERGLESSNALGAHHRAKRRVMGVIGLREFATSVAPGH
jgi:transposase